jgi:hypothetical protein
MAFEKSKVHQNVNEANVEHSEFNVTEGDLVEAKALAGNMSLDEVKDVSFLFKQPMVAWTSSTDTLTSIAHVKCAGYARA